MTRREFGHIFQRPGRKGWYLRVTQGGKRRDLKAGATPKEARAFAVRYEAALAEQAPIDPEQTERVAFDRLSEQFLVHRAKTRAESTVRRERTTVRNIVAPEFGKRFVDEITKLDVVRFVEGRMGVVGSGGRNRMLSLLSSIFKFAVSRGYALENPAAGIERQREARRQFPWIERADQEAMIAACSERIRELAAVALDTGMRKGELLRLVWSDVHFEHGARGVVVVSRSKTGKPRTIPMTRRVREVLADRKLRRVVPMDGPDRVFWDAPTRSEHWGSVWNREWKQGPTAIGKPGLRFHDLRHLFCANLARAGVPMSDIAKLAGHSMAMAMRYADHSPENSSEVAIGKLDGVSAASVKEGGA